MAAFIFSAKQRVRFTSDFHRADFATESATTEALINPITTPPSRHVLYWKLLSIKTPIKCNDCQMAVS